ncbi:protein enhancer of sevenless 2B [Strongylocentrotus purpuratus]|uniref:Growth factor receptor-bound protein 2 n=1 Tax=Strongylocentrotus purpuratus TaxID=7668 RepID=A0A7M7NSQ8_STRPU|nr:protein enhancer of sevenless 2B [Strongylocentrotus purpuratus]|eukprot:XP_786023.2 PREDICTED: protein enhancer of sevenless 2B [Strongylocentrotus purpuratus]
MEYVALFDFSPSKEEQDELAFKKGEVLKVIKREDRHWLLAHQGAKQGLVPENYLKIEKSHPWYVGKISRKVAEEYLMSMPSDGAFMIRDSESNPDSGNFSLSVKFRDQVQHFKILTDLAGKYFLWVVKFTSINDLVDYHKDNSVSRTQEIVLNEPCVPIEDANQRPQPAMQQSRERLQQVKALYNFESDDAQELTFKQNDVITLTGRPHADWWEGEIRAPTGTRRGIFPKNYVKELDPHMH